MPPLVSILIPCYNAALWLAGTLESALGQTWSECEIIVVDDGSTDASVAIATAFAGRGVRLLRQPNRGAAAARNTAYRAARGDYLQFLDADDLLAPTKIALQMARAAQLGERYAYAGTWSRFHRSIADANFAPQPLSVDATAVDWLVEKLSHNRMMHPAAWLISRQLAECAGPWDETLSLDDDGEYFTRVVLASDGVRCCPAAISYYRSQLPGSLSDSKSERAWQSAASSLHSATQRLLAVENSPRTRRACATALQRFTFEAYPRARAARAAAAAEVRALGGSDLAPEGGPKFRLAARFLGWRFAKRLAGLR